MTLFVFTMPSLQGILCRVTQLPDCRLDAFSQLQIEPNRLNAVLVRIHGLPPGSPTFCPHPHVEHTGPLKRRAGERSDRHGNIEHHSTLALSRSCLVARDRQTPRRIEKHGQAIYPCRHCAAELSRTPES